MMPYLWQNILILMVNGIACGVLGFTIGDAVNEGIAFSGYVCGYADATHKIAYDYLATSFESCGPYREAAKKRNFP